jgi:hypothetical protein
MCYDKGIRFMRYARRSTYPLTPYLLSDNDTCYDKSNLDFITFKVKIGIKELGNDVV